MEKPEYDEPVLLGYLSEPVAAADDTCHVYDPKIGGRPAWIHTPYTVPPCSRCGAPLRLLLQTFDPVEEFAELERVIYLFVCNKSDCSNSTGWFVLRGQRVADGVAPTPPAQAAVATQPPQLAQPTTKPAATSLFSAGWDDEPTDAAPEPEPDLDTLLKMRDLKLNAPAPAPAPAATPPVPKGDEVPFEGVSGKDVFTAYWLEIAPEPAAAKQKEIKIEQVQVEPEEPGESYGEEGYEESENKALLKFQKRLERSPEQVVRYSWRGKPRWVSDTPPTVPPCAACGAPRVFELQVMPPLPYLLECAPDALDYATAAVFVCSKSCGGAGNFVEFVAAQAF